MYLSHGWLHPRWLSVWLGNHGALSQWMLPTLEFLASHQTAGKSHAPPNRGKLWTNVKFHLHVDEHLPPMQICLYHHPKRWKQANGILICYPSLHIGIQWAYHHGIPCVPCVPGHTMIGWFLGMPYTSNEFSEKFQAAFDPTLIFGKSYCNFFWNSWLKYRL